MLTGLCAVFAPIGNIVTAIGTGGLSGDATDPSTIPFWSFVGGCCMMAIGISAVLTGFAECIHDAGNTRVTTWAILLTQVRQKNAGGSKTTAIHFADTFDPYTGSSLNQVMLLLIFCLFFLPCRLLLFRTLWIWLTLEKLAPKTPPSFGTRLTSEGLKYPPK